MVKNQIYSEDESLDRIRRRLRGETPGETPETLPNELYSSNESLSEIAELIQATLDGEYARHPTSQFGQVYIHSGTAVQGVADEQWTRVTLLSSDGESSGLIAPGSSAITINDVGTYLGGFHVNFIGIPTARIYDWRIEWNLTGQDQIRDRVELVTGTFAQATAFGLISVTESPAFSSDIQLYVWGENGTGTLRVLDGQMYVLKVY